VHCDCRLHIAGKRASANSYFIRSKPDQHSIVLAYGTEGDEAQAGLPFLNPRQLINGGSFSLAKGCNYFCKPVREQVRQRILVYNDYRLAVKGILKMIAGIHQSGGSNHFPVAPNLQLMRYTLFTIVS